ncbi:MAG: DUF2029 domain-containing protein [Chloroflexi bacterium]|nr:DUF2029 domain-containing protein [Chloroflexota bacterium]
MKRVDFRRILVAGGLIALAIIDAMLWTRMITSPSERTGSDFIAFYTAGRVAQTDGLERVYEPDLQQAVQEGVVGFDLAPGQVLLYNHVPYLVPILMALVNGNYVASFVRWTLVLAALFAIGAVLLTGLLRREGWSKGEAWVAAAGMLTFFPLFVSLLNGQDTAFTMLGLCLGVFGLLTGREWLAGLGLALATVRPHIAVLLAVPFLFRRQKVFGWFCVGTAVLGLFSLLLLGWAGARGFLDLLLVSAGGEFYGMHESAMVNLVGLLTRLAPGLEAHLIRWVGWGVYLAAIIVLCIIWARSRALGERHFGLAVLLSVFFAPHLHYHDLTLLLIPLTCVMLFVVRAGWMKRKTAALLPLAVSLVLLLGNLVMALKYNMPYLVMVILVLILWWPKLFFRPAISQKVNP